MTISKKIKLALVYANMSEAQLARAFGITPQAFNQRMKEDRFTNEDLEKIAQILGASYRCEFQFPDGTTF